MRSGGDAGVAVDAASPIPQVELVSIEGELRFREMADNAPMMIWTSGVDKACTWFNRRWLDFTGRSLEQELGDGWTENVHPEDFAGCMEVYSQAFDARQCFEMDYRMRRRDSAYRWIRDRGAPNFVKGAFAGFIGSCTDVTEQRLVEETLRARVEQGVRELSAANDRLQRQIEENRRIERLLAVENRVLELMAMGADDVLGSLCTLLEGLLPHARCVIRLASQAGDTIGTPVVGVDVFGALSEKGVWPPLHTKREIVSESPPSISGMPASGVGSCWIEPIPGPGAAPLGVIGVYGLDPEIPGEDARYTIATAARLAAIVIERSQAERRSREQLAQLAHVARLATMGEMASGLAHELNQPLCAIVNYTEACVELVNRAQSDNEQLALALGEVTRQAERAGAVIRRLRDFVKRGEPLRESVDVNAVVREVVALTGVEARHSDVRIRVRLAKRPPKVYADALQVEQVLVNLVRNACESMRESGVPGRVLTIETCRRKGAVEVQVRDTGPGMPDEVRERMFDPFFSTRRGGLGMGFSISRSIIEAHEGRIWVAAPPREGSAIHFTLPTAWRALHGRKRRVRSR